MTTANERLLIEAIGSKQARTVARRLVDEQSAVAPLAQRVLDSCEAISTRANEEIARLGQHADLANAGLTAEPSGQFHQILGKLGSWEDVAGVVDRLRTEGYVTWHQLSGAGEAALYRSVSQTTLVHLDDEPLVIELTWPPGPLANLPSPLRPGPADFSAAEVPEPLWPAYALVRPIRLFAERTGVRNPKPQAQLGPILSTPRTLISALLDLAGVGPDDHLVDLGCGEGRIVIEAVKQVGCRATGVESDDRLVLRARQNVANDLGLNPAATIQSGDARTFDLSDATVVFLFIPAAAVPEVVGDIRKRGFSGRIVSHEQASLPLGLAPSESHVLAVDGALTVAHLW